jgi:hypothetical protein
LVAEAQLDTTTSFTKLSAKMIKLSSGNYRLCVGGVAASGAVGKFVTRDIFSVGSIPVSTSESEPKLPSTYTQLSDVSVMDSANDKCYYSVIHDDGDVSLQIIISNLLIIYLIGNEQLCNCSSGYRTSNSDSNSLPHRYSNSQCFIYVVYLFNKRKQKR